MLPLAHSGRAAGEARPELADIFRSHGESYRKTHCLSASQRKVMRAVSVCRTQELGGHLDRCDSCGFERPAYNSCRNRHCPKCQSLAKAKWLETQTSELLPVGYFHLVFTLPHVFNGLILANKKILLKLLFQAVSETLLEFGRTRLGGTLGIIAVLHTWDQTLKDHFHLHCLIPSGALSFDHSRFIAARLNFLFPVKALSRVFRGKFIDLLKHNIDRGKIAAANNEIQALWKKNWVVYAKKPFGSPQTVLDYLGRYTHRVALSNNRILSVQNGQVTLSYRDRKDGDRKKTITLEAEEFIRRFLLHVLPFLPTAPRNTPSLNAASSWGSTPLCPKSPTDQPTICCYSSPASILPAARAARRER